mgnify:CR=1 FL=1
MPFKPGSSACERAGLAALPQLKPGAGLSRPHHIPSAGAAPSPPSKLRPSSCDSSSSPPSCPPNPCPTLQTEGERDTLSKADRRVWRWACVAVGVWGSGRVWRWACGAAARRAGAYRHRLRPLRDRPQGFYPTRGGDKRRGYEATCRATPSACSGWDALSAAVIRQVRAASAQGEGREGWVLDGTLQPRERSLLLAPLVSPTPPRHAHPAP